MPNSPLFRDQVPTDAEILDVHGDRPGIHDQYLVRMDPAWTDGSAILVRSTEVPGEDVVWAAMSDDGDYAPLTREDEAICEAVFQELRIPEAMIMCNCTPEAV